ncbi:hypothetical protein [uncultured Sphingomonas sp.]
MTAFIACGQIALAVADIIEEGIRDCEPVRREPGIGHDAIAQCRQ